MRAATVTLLLVVAAAEPLAGKIQVQVGVQLQATSAHVGGVTSNAGLATGTLIGGRGSAALGPLQLSLSYREGRMHDGAAQPLLVEGGAGADVQILPWLVAGIGPEARAYKLDSATARRVWLAGRIGIDAPLIGTAVRTDLRLWRSLVTSATDVDLTRVSGGEVGIAYRAPAHWWVRMSTTIDDAVLPGPHHERLFGLTLGAGLGR